VTWAVGPAVEQVSIARVLVNASIYCCRLGFVSVVLVHLITVVELSSALLINHRPSANQNRFHNICEHLLSSSSETE
jgi:hypothetical protein